MGISTLLCCLLWATTISSLCDAQSPSFLITAPRLLHLGVGEDVWVQVEWPQGLQAANGDVKVDMYLRNQKNYAECTARYTATLHKGNNYIAKQTIELTPERASLCKLEGKRSERYVQLVVSSPSISAKPQVVSIPVAYKRGYIFIQTDKSIYTPKETVNFRVFTLDHMMRPKSEPTVCTVFNAEGLKVTSFTKQASIIPGKIQIPDIASPGVWRISAYYSSAPESNSSAEFEVKKYVLPNFEVKIIPELPYFLVTGKEFKIKVEARYVYGEDVDGVTYVRLGIIGQDGQKTLLQGLEQNVKLTDGEGTVVVRKEDIVKKINQPEENLVGATFYIAVSVMEAASGTLEEKEITSVKFVRSPYILDLSKTRRYFTPGTPMSVVVEVTHTDGSPAPGVPVKLFKSNVELGSSTSDNHGGTFLQINTDANQKSFEIKVTAGRDGARQEELLHLTPYSSNANSFLYLDLPNQILSPGENVKVTAKIMTSDPGKVKKVYYMILNKGQILELKSIDRSEFMVINVPVTAKMVPSFRVLAYYYLSSEIVANSIWVDVMDVCEGKLELRTDVRDSIQPGDSFKLTIETDDKTTVSLSAVDTAVYLLNSKNKLTPTKVFKAMNAYDLGCSPGSGKDYKSVFMDAGVAFMSSAGYSNMNEFGCKVPQRKKRSVEFSALANQKVSKYPKQTLKQCCIAGMRLLPGNMDRKCENRANRVPDDDCRKAFLDCCKYAEELRKKIKLEKKSDNIGRTQNQEEEEDFTDEGEVQVRSSFPETWLWRTVTVDKRYTETLSVHDSITTWEIQGIGISEKKGFCVAEPIKVRVFKDFHVHLRVPYSVKRFEQMELRPVLYNYYEVDMKVKVSLDKSEDLCTATTAEGDPIERIVTVPSRSAIAVPFVVVPIGKSNPMVTVKALGIDGVADIVKKPLRILREGVSVLEEKTYMIDPKDRRRNEITVDEELPSNMIPDGDFRTSVMISVDSPMNTINNSLSSDGVSRLIRVPYGCAEQTMISTAPGVYALRYLDHANKWTQLPPDRKDVALENMNNGYSRILQYRKTDGSYGAWLQRPSSTWLTAFVVKVMSLCRKYIDVEVEEIRRSALYLTTKQSGTGAFLETTAVIHKDMMGGIAANTADVSLTAYVLVALHHAKDAMPEDDTKVRNSIAKAIDYLRSILKNVKEPYSLAVTAYALNLASSDSILKKTAYNNLMSTAQDGRNKKTVHFGPAGTALAVEATSYALLTALLQEELPSAKKMYVWLSEQENYGGGFKSTQDTVMALEALSEYWIKTDTGDVDEILVEINSLEKSLRQEVRLRSGESSQEELRSMGTKFRVKMTGKGTGVLKVLKMYNIIQVEDTTCSQLELTIKVHGDINAGDEENDYNYDYGEETMSDEPMRSIDWHDLRSRARREASQPKAKDEKVVYEVCIRRKSQTATSGMAIVDITMLSGFQPSTQDLDKLKGDLEDYISHYEIQGGRLIMYFDKVSQNKECVSFEAVQTVKISPLQPASAILYDFYEPENQCRIFYGGPDKPSLVSTLCSGDVCQCAEGLCPMRRRTLDLKGIGRRDFACYNPRVVYGYRVKLVNKSEEEAFTVYTVHIEEVLQKNSDEHITKGDTRYFYQRSTCKTRLGDNKEYLIMGQDGQTKDDKGRIRYLLESNSWVEELAGPQICKATRNRNACNDMNNFMEDYRTNGCMV